MGEKWSKMMPKLPYTGRCERADPLRQVGVRTGADIGDAADVHDRQPAALAQRGFEVVADAAAAAPAWSPFLRRRNNAGLTAPIH